MIRGYYTALAGMVTTVRRTEIAINNIANVQTPGFKQERTSSSVFNEQLLTQLQDGQPTTVGPIVLTNVARSPEIDFTQGPLEHTGRELDLALNGQGFLVVDHGGPAFTRDGSLSRDAEGYLTTRTGRLVLGVNGPIRAASDPIQVAPDGTVTSGGGAVGRLRIVEFEDPKALRRQGDNLLVVGEGAPPRDAERTELQQGFLEASNVDVSSNMVSLLELQRAYESSLRLIQFQNETLSRSVTEIGRPAS